MLFLFQSTFDTYSKAEETGHMVKFFNSLQAKLAAAEKQ